MLRFALFLAALAILTHLQAAPKEVTFQGFLTPQGIIPLFDHGYVAVFEPTDQVNLFDRTGEFLFRATVHGASGALMAPISTAVDTDGTLAVAVSSFGSMATGGFALFERSGSQRRFVKTDLYQPTAICFAPDHSLWTIGSVEHNAPEAQDYFVLRHYSQDGAELGKFLRRSAFPPEHEPAEVIVGPRRIAATENRVGALLRKGEGEHAWMEFDLSGKVTGTWDASTIHGLTTMTADGDVYGVAHPDQVRMLDRSSGTWKVVRSGASGTFLSVEGPDFVYLVRGESKLRWEPI